MQRRSQCRSHGGTAAQTKAKAEREEAEERQRAAALKLAAPIETTAADAMRDVLWATNGLRAHYWRQIEERGTLSRSPGEWDDTDRALIALHEFADRWYFRVAAECRRANIDEARFELEHADYERIDRILRGVFRRAGMDPDSPEVAGHIVAELTLIAGGKS